MFFNVKDTITILGKTYKPCICYELPNYLIRTVEKLEAEGKVSLNKERVFFCNGKLIEHKTSVNTKTKKEKKIISKEESTESTNDLNVTEESIIEGF